MRVLFLLLVIIPIVEIWLLITVGQKIGALPTIGLVLLTAFIGVSLLRYQGATTLLRARSKMQTGGLPAREIADGLFFAVGGALLLTPGFVTDILGFACLTPGIRTWFIGSVVQYVFRRTAKSPFQQPPFPDQKNSVKCVIEGNFERHNDDHKG